MVINRKKTTKNSIILNNKRKSEIPYRLVQVRFKREVVEDLEQIAAETGLGHVTAVARVAIVSYVEEYFKR